MKSGEIEYCHSQYNHRGRSQLLRPRPQPTGKTVGQSSHISVSCEHSDPGPNDVAVSTAPRMGGLCLTLDPIWSAYLFMIEIAGSIRFVQPGTEPGHFERGAVEGTTISWLDSLQLRQR